MSKRCVLWVLILTTLGGTIRCSEVKREEKTLHRLVGGHISYNSEGDAADSELLETKESGGRKPKQAKIEEEDKKTLAQQVADGKYGLIQKEIFGKPAKRPGIISYEGNSEVPKDTIKNLGGLTKNDIWLAENHLLVLKGGSFPPHDEHQDNLPPVWPPIDAYVAPQRQVKIPANPKVPPPFPVQLTEDGPLQILGTNFTRTFNGSYESPPYSILPPEGIDPGEIPFYPYTGPDQANTTSGETPQPVPPYPPYFPGDFYPGNGPPPFPYPLNDTLPPYFANLPPGAVFLPPPDNQTDYDEDDPSIYYPPPYSFYYPKDNSSVVEPGPLVPGIVLPPPPDFFAPLEETTTTPDKKVPVKYLPVKPNTEKPVTTKPITLKPGTPKPITLKPITVKPVTIKSDISQSTPTPKQFITKLKPSVPKLKPSYIPTTITPIKQINPPTTPLPPTSVIDNTPYRIPVKLPEFVSKIKTTTTPVVTVVPLYHSNYSSAHFFTGKQTTSRKKPSTVTILKPVKQTTRPPIYFYESNEVSGKPFEVYGPPSSSVTTTKIPLKVYYSTSNDIDTNSVTQPSHSGRIPTLQTQKTPKPPAEYYYYEESTSTTKPRSAKQDKKTNYLNIPQSYYVPVKSVNVNVPSVEVEIKEIQGQTPEERLRAIQQVEFAKGQLRPVQLREDQVQIQPHSYLQGMTEEQLQELREQKLQDLRRQKLQELREQKFQQQHYQDSRGRYQQQARDQYQQQQDLQEQQRLQNQLQFRQQRIQSSSQKQFQQNEPQYYYVTSRPYTEKPRFRFVQTTKKPDTFGIHIARIKEQIEQFYTTPKPTRQRYPNTAKSTPKPVYQFSFEAANYKQQHEALAKPQVQEDQDKFRPLPHYSVEIQQAVEVIPNDGKVPRPVYYPNEEGGNYNVKIQNFQQNGRGEIHEAGRFVVTPKPISQFSFGTTPNPIYQHQVYTKQDEPYFDDITKKYFTMFGKKIPTATTPLSRVEVTTVAPVIRPAYSAQEPNKNVQIEYAHSIGKPLSLEGDTLVNYVGKRPQQHPQSEFIHLNQQQGYPQVNKYVTQQSFVKPGHSLHGDIKVNYKLPRPTPNPDVEIVQAVNVPTTNNNGNKGGSFISYQLPGDDGAHFYFLTPQLAQRREQGVGYYYSQPNNERRRRSKRDKGS